MTLKPDQASAPARRHSFWGKGGGNHILKEILSLRRASCCFSGGEEECTGGDAAAPEGGPRRDRQEWRGRGVSVQAAWPTLSLFAECMRRPNSRRWMARIFGHDSGQRMKRGQSLRTCPS